MSRLKFIDPTGKEVTEIDFPEGFVSPDGRLSPKTYACAIRVLLQNWRQGTVSCKSRGELAFSNRKPWKQKGTGRARAGSLRSPLWRKGGVIFGPQPRVKELKINRKQRKLCLKNLLHMMLSSGAVYCLDYDFSTKQVPKTKEAAALLKNMGVKDKKGIMFLPYEDTMNFAAFRNISSISILTFDQPNVFDLSSIGYWIFLKKDLQQFKDMVAKWL